MADTRDQHRAEKWIVDIGLPQRHPGLLFSGKKLRLIWGGEFAFDAVSDDLSIVACVSTSAAVTASGKLGTAKVQKLKTDALYLLHLAIPARRIMVFTDASMHAHFERARRTGRFPPSDLIEVVHMPLPSDLQEHVLDSQKVASVETSPQKTALSRR